MRVEHVLPEAVSDQNSKLIHTSQMIVIQI